LGLSAPGFSTEKAIPVTLTVADKGNTYAVENNLPASNGLRHPGMLILAGATRTVVEDWTSPPLICLPRQITLGSASASAWILSSGRRAACRQPSSAW
jgi:predicted DNA-binding transcriptional regulator AlpA